MRFCPWYPLADAATAAPAEPGVFQLKLPHLLDYPTGKSAMIHYGASPDVRAALVALAGELAGRPVLARHAEALTAREAADPAAALAPLSDAFRRRFGAEPHLP